MAARIAGTIPANAEWVAQSDGTWLVGDGNGHGHDDNTYHAPPHTGGYEYNTRTVITHSVAGGIPCPSLYETKECLGSGPCPIDCEQSEWTAFSACTKSCGGGTQFQTRTTVVTNQHEGTVCGNTKYTTDCNQFACPIDCRLDTWEEWSTCSDTCQSTEMADSYPAQKPTQTRIRHRLTQPEYGGEACAHESETRFCNEHRCPIDCQVSIYPEWSVCSSTVQNDGSLCGYGSRFTNRTITTHPAFAGKPCPALNKEEVCYSGPCDRDCTVSEYSSWSQCTYSCVDNGNNPTQFRTRTVVEAQFQNGAVCPTLYEERQCNRFPCPIDCVLDAWQPWEPTPGNQNTLTRVRNVLVHAANGGIPCGPLSEDKEMPCVDHKRFGSWSDCSKQCGTGKKWRHRNHVYCSQTSAIKYDVSFLQGVDCNTHNCATEADRYITLSPTENPIPALPDVDDGGRRLDESSGAWKVLNADEQAAYELPAGDWKMFEKF